MNSEAFVPRSESKTVFSLAMASYAWTLSAFINAIIRSFHPIVTAPNPYPSSLYWFTVIIDSLLLVGIIELFRRIHARPALQVIIAPLCLCASRFLAEPFWGFNVAPVFFISAFSYVRWRRVSWTSALGIVIFIQALYNVIPVIRTLFQSTRTA